MKNLTKTTFLLLLLMATSCSLRKKTVAPTQPQAFEWMTAKLDIQADRDGMVYEDLSGQMRVRNDSIVWISATATMGVEVMRVKISTDSIWMVNRLDKTYLAEPLDSLATQLGMPISLHWVQTMLWDNNEGLSPVENQTVLLKSFAFGNMNAKIRYNNIRFNEKTSFPLKITNKMERYRLPKKP